MVEKTASYFGNSVDSSGCIRNHIRRNQPACTHTGSDTDHHDCDPVHRQPAGMTPDTQPVPGKELLKGASGRTKASAGLFLFLLKSGSKTTY